MTSTLIANLPYNVRLDQAVEWGSNHPEESFPTSARIHRVKSRNIQSRVVRIRKGRDPEKPFFWRPRVSWATPFNGYRRNLVRNAWSDKLWGWFQSKLYTLSQYNTVRSRFFNALNSAIWINSIWPLKWILNLLIFLAVMSRTPTSNYRCPRHRR